MCCKWGQLAAPECSWGLVPGGLLVPVPHLIRPLVCHCGVQKVQLPASLRACVCTCECAPWDAISLGLISAPAALPAHSANPCSTGFAASLHLSLILSERLAPRPTPPHPKRNSRESKAEATPSPTSPYAATDARQRHRCTDREAGRRRALAPGPPCCPARRWAQGTCSPLPPIPLPARLL